jgi:hypothetical protein
MSMIIDELIQAGVPEHEVERLLMHWGGLPVYVPREIDPDHQIARIAGPQVAQALSRLFGGERIMIPIGASFRRERLRRKVAELKAAGLNHCEIARRLGLHLRQVQRLTQAHHDADPPGE